MQTSAQLYSGGTAAEATEPPRNLSGRDSEDDFASDGDLASSAVSRPHGEGDLAPLKDNLVSNDDRASAGGNAPTKKTLKKSPSSVSRAEDVEDPTFSVELTEVLQRSPAIQAFQRQLHSAREAYTSASRQAIDDEENVAAEGDAADSLTHPLLALQKRVQRCEEQLDQAIQAEREHFFKKHSNPAPAHRVAHTRIGHSQAKTAVQPKHRDPTDEEDHDFEASEPSRRTHRQERKNLHRFDDEERAAIRNSRRIEAEPRSPDSPASERDRNGYDRKDGFVASDESLDLSLSSSPSTDDDSATTYSSEDRPSAARVNSGRYRAERMEVIALAMQKAQSKSDGQPPFKPVLSGPALAALRVEAIAIKRRTRHSAMLELILSVWLNNDSGLVDVEHVAEFLSLLRQHQLECAKSVYFVLCKRIRPVSFTLFKFLYFCITRYLPAHKSTLLDAYRDVMTKLNLLPASNGKHPPSLSSAPPKTATTPSIEWKGKPITRPPSIANITDIATAVGKFYDEFRAYKREHTAANCHSRTVFQCLSCEQQASFSAMCTTDEATLDAMDDTAFFELWKTHFGLRSSAAVLQAVRALQFVGDPLIPASWTDFHRTFTVTVAQAHAPLVPPLKTLAKFFVTACPDAFLRNDVLSNEPASVPEALQLVIGRLNDSGFLRSALAHARARHAERAPQHQVQGQPQVPPPPIA